MYSYQLVNVMIGKGINVIMLTLSHLIVIFFFNIIQFSNFITAKELYGQ